ncbi:hypothetical protein EST38_g1408 [Candolleomyces aberdarensis]|uniref:DUF221-domain-containing protein n=1 Tax=Candolleomyces aberdarensis TaxID=2316362 RepID=A0A4Q2DY34_9AGAR|nr:hypothetical protein EST38_g1408 [Candolleomyces aberdarensis]
MGDIQTRPFSKNYSGLINQTVIGIAITVLCVTGQELMKRRRRKGRKVPPEEGLGKRESWEFGYLYSGRSWARFPSPPSPTGWALSWIREVIGYSEDELHSLRGTDATLYVRFLRGCFWFSLLHTVTTFPILFPIHVEFSEHEISQKSMTRASISSLVATDKGLSLLWIHMCLLFWITLSWMGTLIWICNGAFRLRARSIAQLAHRRREALENPDAVDATLYQHPHPQYAFQDIPTPAMGHPNYGLRLRTVMVSNLPHGLRDEKELKEYFEYWLSRKVEKPSMGLTSSTQPGLVNKTLAFMFNRAKKIPARVQNVLPTSNKDEDRNSNEPKRASKPQTQDKPIVERVVVARKMTELASLLERREEILRLLETAHIKLANKALLDVQEAMERKKAQKPFSHHRSSKAKAIEVAKKRRSVAVDVEQGQVEMDDLSDEERMEKLIETLGPFVEQFSMRETKKNQSQRFSKWKFKHLRQSSDSSSSDSGSEESSYPRGTQGSKGSRSGETIWDALLSLPRCALDAYQPLVNLSHLFRGKTVPAIDYYTAKLNLLTSLITENRSKAITDFDAVSTAFVTFADPAEARRACKYLAVHPNNPLTCSVSMAPEYQDVDWIRVMKSSFNAEFVKDWILNVGVWGFTLFWLFPVSLLVGLVSIQNISLFWPSLKRYLDRHPWQSEVIQSFIPTLLVALLALLIPLILLLIAKKAHTITTLSALHDLIMTRYYKFLIVNVLVFFCVGTAAMESILLSFRNVANIKLIEIVATSFPSAGPFYVGWLIFTTAMHGGFELVLLGLPLIMYPTTSRQVTPRKRTVGVRPRTLNYYYWLPNHLLVIHVLLMFSALNPFVLPFGTLYFFVQSGVIKNQFIHVYAKHYEGNGQTLLIRMVRYSLDGLTLTLVVFLAYMVVLKKSANVGVCVFLIVFIVLFKLLMTRMCRAQFELDDIAEAEVMCKQTFEQPRGSDVAPEDNENAINQERRGLIQTSSRRHAFLTWKMPDWINFSYSTIRQRPNPHKNRRKPIPFDRDFKVSPRTSSAKPQSPAPDVNVSREGFPWQSHDQSATVPGHPRFMDASLRPESSGPVVPHPPPLPWDDQETVDLPYDNPYYTRLINNVLWLPRDPVNALDLDNTVDMKLALTVDPGTGQIGTWLGLVERSSPEEMMPTPSPVIHAANMSPMTLPVSFTSLPEVDGTEEIDLPPTIRQRVQANERGIEQTMRPRRSTVSHAQSSKLDVTSLASHPLSGLPQRKPSTLTLQPPTRSASDGAAPPTLRTRSHSIMSTLQLPPSVVTPNLGEQESGERPDAHAQADLIAAVATNSKLSLAPSIGRTAGRSQNLSAQHAILHEILAEEKQALLDRLQEEQAESSSSPSTRSWLLSWMFKKSD